VAQYVPHSVVRGRGFRVLRIRRVAEQSRAQVVRCLQAEDAFSSSGVLMPYSKIDC